MRGCELHLLQRFAYAPTSSGLMAPRLDLALFAPPMAMVLETAFVVDTGCDVPLILARPLRNALLQARVMPRRAALDWGGPVECEFFLVSVHTGVRWRTVEAFYPLDPESDENLAGLPLIDDLTLCLRAPHYELFSASA